MAHPNSFDDWLHSHCFIEVDSSRAERRTIIVAVLTIVMMVLEIAAGHVLGSMALLADGLHMGSHAFALGISVFAYVYARRNARNPRYTFGTGKVNALGGYTGAVVLGLVALAMVWESFDRMLHPVPIRYAEALAVAFLGLGVNAVSAFILRGAHEHHHHDHSGAEHGHGHHDHNLRSAYLHVLADAATSVLAIGALIAGWYYRVAWLDPMVGVLGALLVSHWAYGLLKGSAAVLLDQEGPRKISQMIRSALEQDGDRIADLHCWAIAPGRYAAIVSLVAHEPMPAAHYKARVPADKRLAHFTVEVDAWSGAAA